MDRAGSDVSCFGHLTIGLPFLFAPLKLSETSKGKNGLQPACEEQTLSVTACQLHAKTLSFTCRASLSRRLTRNLCRKTPGTQTPILRNWSSAKTFRRRLPYVGVPQGRVRVRGPEEQTPGGTATCEPLRCTGDAGDAAEATKTNAAKPCFSCNRAAAWFVATL